MADYTHMRCLYCGKELALLKRLTGGSEFCSDAHKHSYQEEYNRLAVSRLMQAQAKAAQKHAAPDPPESAPGPVAVEVAEEEPPPVETVEIPDPSEAGFLNGKPPFSAVPCGQPYVEPWLGGAGLSTPALPQWELHDELPALPVMGLFRLEVHPTEWRKESAVETKTSPKEFAPAKTTFHAPLTISATNELPSARAIDLDVPSRPSQSTREVSLHRTYDFQVEAISKSGALLELTAGPIEFPAEQAGIATEASWLEFPPAEESASADAAVQDSEPVWEDPEASPRAALQALARLHQDMAQQEETSATRSEEPAQEDQEMVYEEVVRVSAPFEAAAEVAVPVVAATVAVVTPVIVAEAVEEQPPAPREVSEFLDIPFERFAPQPSRAGLEVTALETNGRPILPRLTALPLRPKVGVAPRDFMLPPPPEDSRSAAIEASPDARESAPPPKPAPPARPAPKGQPMAAKAAEPPRAAASAAQKPARSAKTTPPAAASTAPKNPPAESKPPAAQDPVKKPAPRPAEPARKPAPRPAPDAPTLTFETLELQLMASAKPSFLGSLKVKLGVAILLVAGVFGAYVGFGNKSHKLGPAAAEDAAGPSIMVGEGGWVESWAGDPIGSHAGRQITIYRPSLKLSDYRIEFQGNIENRSVGWVFRAADPENYYVMKLAIVTPGLTPKIALLKYLVLKGREMELGRVPIDLPVTNDTTFHIRVDVRGPRFKTYVQGKQVDLWTNDQLKSGGVGFLNERGERARVKAVAINYLNGVDK